MKILILGFSSIVERRVLPALDRIEAIEKVDIASRSSNKGDNSSFLKKGEFYEDYAKALKETDADLVYISLINSLHGHWAEAALKAGKHVVVDKPAFLSLVETERMVKMADQASLCLAEAIVIRDHPQFGVLRDLIVANGEASRLAAVFSVPSFPISNFRNHADLGGGVLLDMGPYVATLGWNFFNRPPEEVVCRVISRHPETNVDTAISVLVCYPDSGSFVGHFGFGTEYQNRITVVGEKLALTLDRVFTIPPDFENKVYVNRQNEQSTIVCSAADTFELFFSRLIKSIQLNDWSEFSRDIMRNISFRELMIRSAQENQK
jgi:predicted dehydrogenase